ncbi:hypothetical protein [Paenibacillus periandrae]|uniref:hypothetical protein n=1 Tax=Paenibacillus periandrae TaxID=1761741 RepID=UPI001F08DF8D|nr:hypothetical protein [Paenibacillus periandrae]
MNKKVSFNGEKGCVIVSDTEALKGPRQAFEIDVILADVYLDRSDSAKYFIGRPVICNVVDKCSGKIVDLEVRL